VGPNGEQVGIVRIEDALRLAQEAELDLVEVAATARPPVCRLMDYGKFKYESAMKARESRRNQTNVVLKEQKFRPKIDSHDYDTKKRNVERFLHEGDKVKVTIMFRGREQSRPELGFRLLQRLAEDVSELGSVESSPKQDGRNMIMVLGPIRKKADAKAERDRKQSDAKTEREAEHDAEAERRAAARGASAAREAAAVAAAEVTAEPEVEEPGAAVVFQTRAPRPASRPGEGSDRPAPVYRSEGPPRRPAATGSGRPYAGPGAPSGPSSTGGPGATRPGTAARPTGPRAPVGPGTGAPVRPPGVADAAVPVTGTDTADATPESAASAPPADSASAPVASPAPVAPRSTSSASASSSRPAPTRSGTPVTGASTGAAATRPSPGSARPGPTPGRPVGPGRPPTPGGIRRPTPAPAPSPTPAPTAPAEGDEPA
jgi:translation initiation factor IF-3